MAARWRPNALSARVSCSSDRTVVNNTVSAGTPEPVSDENKDPASVVASSKTLGNDAVVRSCA